MPNNVHTMNKYGQNITFDHHHNQNEWKCEREKGKLFRYARHAKILCKPQWTQQPMNIALHKAIPDCYLLFSAIYLSLCFAFDLRSGVVHYSTDFDFCVAKFLFIPLCLCCPIISIWLRLNDVQFCWTLLKKKKNASQFSQSTNQQALFITLLPFSV